MIIKEGATLMIGSIGYTTYAYPAAGVNALNSPASAVAKISNIRPVAETATILVDKAQQAECQTCKDRKYMDVSNEANVSFQTPTHISPEASFAAVSAHEQQHVANAAATGSQPGNRLAYSSVSLKMGVCPECGKPYIAGGTTKTQIKYNEANPYEASRKSIESSLLKGMYFDSVA